MVGIFGEIFWHNLGEPLKIPLCNMGGQVSVGPWAKEGDGDTGVLVQGW